MHVQAKRGRVWLPSLVIVRSTSDLRALRNAGNRRFLLPLLRLPGVPAELSREWESKLKTSLRECGCSLGAKCVVAGAGASVVWQSLYSHWNVGQSPAFLLRTLLLCFAAGMGGKLASKARASARIDRIEEKMREFEQRSSDGVH